MRDIIQATVSPGIYRHWKSGSDDQKFYVVYETALDVETNEPAVICASLYGRHAGHLASRHLTNAEHGFLMPVYKPEYQGQRFRQIVKMDESAVAITRNWILECVRSKGIIEKNEEAFLERVKQMLGTN